jgi:2-C-methyl-D-erythritol 4-phosphate cytidylyltransferase
MNRRIIGILLAAGSSARMGENKLLMPLYNDENALKLSFEAMSASNIDEIIITDSDDTESYARDLCEQSHKKAICVRGGATRAQSVMNALEHCQYADIAVIHDAARCLILPETINTSINEAKIYGSAIAASRVVDTLRNESTSETIDRSEILAMQTPQAFKADLIISAYKAAIESGIEFTDDCEAYIKAGHTPHYFINDLPNMKLTIRGDIEVFSAIISNRRVCRCV